MFIIAQKIQKQFPLEEPLALKLIIRIHGSYVYFFIKKNTIKKMHRLYI